MSRTNIPNDDDARQRAQSCEHVAEVTGWDGDNESVAWTGYGDTEQTAIDDAIKRGGIVEVGDVRTSVHDTSDPDAQERAYEIASAEVVFTMTRDEANAVAECLHERIEAVAADEDVPKAERMREVEWLGAICDRLLITPGVH